MEKEINAAMIPELEVGTFIVLYLEKPVDSGIILDKNKLNYTIDFLSNQKEDTVRLIGDPESNIWAICHKNLDGTPCFSQRGDFFTIRATDRRVQLAKRN
jgi:hypothetical protein